MARPRYTITTPIYYATDEPHIGHAYCSVAADAAARYRRLTGHDVFFLTGTDEHGQKMERQAQARGISPQALADETAPRYLELWAALGISHDAFIRTTEARHRKAVEEMWRRMAARGDLYKDAYEAPYCIECESFYLEKELVEGKCPDHGVVLERQREEGWFFRLSAYADRLLAHYASHPGFVQPESRLNEVTSFVRSGLRDLSVSRATTRWGFEVPGDPGQVIYVWVDALTNYLTGAGFPDDGERLRRWWPADLHLVGKDILRFHAVYWPAFLMSAGIDLPRAVFGHGWWLRDGRKIAKSAGGVIKVQPLIARFGADALRYFLLREVPFGLDGAYSDQALLGRYNSDLANDFGNLVSRTLQVVSRYRDGRVPARAEPPPAIRELASEALAAYRRHFDALAFSRGIDAAWEMVRAGNRFIDEQAPWVLARDPARSADLDRTLYVAADLVRLVASCLWPVMPQKCESVRRSLGLASAEPQLADLAVGGLEPGTRINEFTPLFPRVDAGEWLGPAAAAKPAAVVTGLAATGAAATGPAPEPATAEISVDEFFRADLRVARVKSAERVAKSKKLLRLIVDLGGEERQVVAGIAEKYPPESLVGKNVVVVANLKPAKLMGVESRGMLLAASVDGLPVIATFAEDVPPGTRVK